MCLLVAVVLRAWVLEGLVFPVRIAGSSMAESFHGPHLEVTCADCGYHYACDLEALESLPATTCPNCGYRENRIVDGHKAQYGDRLLIDKITYNLRTPERWESILFRCSAPQYGYCIKRIVGLPGETVTVRQGDVFIGSQRARKTLDQLRRLAIPVFDARYPSSSSPARWIPERGNTGWTKSADAFHYKPSEDGISENGTEAWIEYHHRRSRREGDEPGPVNDNYGYNQTVSRSLNSVRDLVLVADITASGSGSVLLSISASDSKYRLQLDLAAGQGNLLCNGKSLRSFSLPPALLAQPALIEFAVVDHQLLLAIDGESILTFNCDEQTSDHRAGLAEQTENQLLASPVAIGVTGQLDVRIENVKLFRDVYYTTDLGEITRTLGEDEFFVLGDNSPISVDSRQGLVVKAENVFGKPLLWR